MNENNNTNGAKSEVSNPKTSTGNTDTAEMQNHLPESKSTEQDKDAQANTGVSPVEPSTDKIKDFLDGFGSKLTSMKVKYVISYNEAKKLGLRVVFLKGNRNVVKSQLDKLWRDIKDDEKKVFDEECNVVPARPILETFPDIELYDLSGESITLDTPDLDKCVAVYDGQHRITVVEMHQPDENKPDVKLELNEFDGKDPFTVIKRLNSFSKNWNNEDLKHTNIVNGSMDSSLFDDAAKLQNRYGLTPKCAEYWITFVKDATKKNDLIAGKATTTYVESNSKRGQGIFNSIMKVSGNKKQFKKIQFVDAVVAAYNSLGDANKANFGRDMKLYLKSLNDTDVKEITDMIDASNFGQLNEYIKQGFNDFRALGGNAKTLDAWETEWDLELDTFTSELDAKNLEESTSKDLKSGSVSEVIKHNKEAEKKRNAKKIAAAKKKFDEAKEVYDKAKSEQK